MISLYDEAAKKIMLAADEISRLRTNRIDEIKSLAIKTGMKRIGIANCITFGREAKVIANFFSKDFEVFCVDCKYGQLSKQELFGAESRRVLCNPAGQALFLNEKKTDLNLSIGLCVGHDIIFSQKSNAPVTTLFDKDFTNGHDVSVAVQEIASIDN